MLWGKGRGRYHYVLYILCSKHLCAFVCVCVFSPLDTECQYDAVVTLQGFLTLVRGAGVPYLRKRNTCIFRFWARLCHLVRVSVSLSFGCASSFFVRYLNSLVWGSREEQVSRGVDTQTPDWTLVANKRPLTFEDLLGVVRYGEAQTHEGLICSSFETRLNNSSVQIKVTYFGF